jgi:FtsZ-binding cell division protein ZapB
MKQVILIGMCVTLAFGSRRQQIRTLQTRVAEQDSTITEMKIENDSLKKANIALENEADDLRNTAEDLETTVSDLESNVEELKEASLNAEAQLEDCQRRVDSLKSSTGGRTNSSRRSESAVTEQFPMEGTILSKRAHDGSAQALNIAFYNGSRQDLNRFSANLKFYHRSRLIHQVIVDVNEPVRSGENLSWYGAIPYDRSDAGQALFSELERNEMDVEVEVREITTTGGRTRSFLR